MMHKVVWSIILLSLYSTLKTTSMELPQKPRCEVEDLVFQTKTKTWTLTVEQGETTTTYSSKVQGYCLGVTTEFNKFIEKMETSCKLSNPKFREYDETRRTNEFVSSSIRLTMEILMILAIVALGGRLYSLKH